MNHSKRLAALLLTAALALSCAVIGCAANAGKDFSDVPAGADYAAAVAWCAGEGLMNGVDDGRFDPDGSLTRAMLATVLYRRAGEPAVSGGTAFTDAEAGAWYSGAIAWAAEEGLLRGYGDGLFGVNDPVSREMLGVVMARQRGEEPVWTGDAALAADATRAETAVALYQAFAVPVPTAAATPSPTAVPAPSAAPEPAPAGGRILVAYFSATHNTAGIAGHIKAALGDRADLFEIVPETPYTAADLNYNTDCRANREQNDDSARPAIHGTVSGFDQYDAVFLGYPIWWGRAPKIIYTFLESYSWEGKTVIPFCTSGSSPYHNGGIKDLASGSTWLTGRRFSGGASAATVADWVSGLDLPEASHSDGEEANTMYLQVSGAKDALWTATLAENSSAAALAELLKSAPLTLSMHDYGSFEKVGPIGHSLPTNDEQITTQPGDIILYQGNQLTIYYDRNSWNFTRLGKVDGVTQAEMKDVFGTGDVSVTLSLTPPQA